MLLLIAIGFLYKHTTFKALKQMEIMLNKAMFNVTANFSAVQNEPLIVLYIF